MYSLNTEDIFLRHFKAILKAIGLHIGLIFDKTILCYKDVCFKLGTFGLFLYSWGSITPYLIVLEI